MPSNLRTMPPLPIAPLPRYRYVRKSWRGLCYLFDAVGGLLWALGRWLRCQRRIVGTAATQSESAETATSPRTILLIQLDHLGDALLSTGLCAALNQTYPQANIDVLCGPWNAELFAQLPGIRRVVVAEASRFSRVRPWRGLWATLAWGFRLRSGRYDLAIDPRGELPHAVLMWLTGARRRVGWNAGGGGFLLTDSATFVWGRHEVLSRQAVLACLGIAPPEGEMAWPPRFPVDTRCRFDMAAQLAEAGYAEIAGASASCTDIPPAGETSSASSTAPRLGWSRRPLIVLHLGSGTAAKRWPIESWREVAGRLIVELGAHVVMVGSQADAALGRTLTGPQAWPGLINWTGRLSLAQLAAVIQQADLLIGADSGPAHLAAAVGTPVVALFSGTNRVAQWRPWGHNVLVLRHETACSPCHRTVCPLADHPCMRGLLPHEVLSAAAEQLRRRGSGTNRRTALSQSNQKFLEQALA